MTEIAIIGGGTGGLAAGAFLPRTSVTSRRASIARSSV